MPSFRRVTAAAVLALLLVVPAVVFAAPPEPGGSYRDKKPNITLKVSANGKKVASASIFTKCNLPPLSIYPRAIKEGGRFSYSGPPKDVLGKRGDGTLTVVGRFTSRTVAKGTLRYQDGPCDTGKLKFRATLQ